MCVNIYAEEMTERAATAATLARMQPPESRGDIGDPPPSPLVDGC